MLPFDNLEMSEKRLFDSSGKDRVALFVTLAAPNNYLVPGKIDVLDPEAATFHQSQSCPIEKHCHQGRSSLELSQQSAHLFLREHYGQPPRLLGPNDSLNETDFLLQDIVVQK